MVKGPNREADSRLKELFDQHYEFVWRSARRLGVAPSAVDDAAQEVFVVAARKLDQIRPGSERAFLFGIALRVASDARRARARQPETDDVSDADLELPAEVQSLEESLDQQRARALLDRVMQKLPEDMRVVFALYELEGLAMSEIARYLDIPQGTVASRLRRAREAFSAEVQRVQARMKPKAGES